MNRIASAITWAPVVSTAGCAADSEVEPAAGDTSPAEATAPQDAFWANLQSLCESAAPMLVGGRVEIEPGVRYAYGTIRGPRSGLRLP